MLARVMLLVLGLLVTVFGPAPMRCPDACASPVPASQASTCCGHEAADPAPDAPAAPDAPDRDRGPCAHHCHAPNLAVLAIDQPPPRRTADRVGYARPVDSPVPDSLRLAPEPPPIRPV